MKVRLVFPANIELDEAVRYYDHQLPGLGFRKFIEMAKKKDKNPLDEFQKIKNEMLFDEVNEVFQKHLEDTFKNWKISD